MSRFSRRTFLAGAAAFVATPAFGQAPSRRRSKAAPKGQPKGATRPAPQTPLPAPVDVVVIGAGAAGIAAARRLTAAGRSFVLVEATGRIGGRCVTDTRIFGMPFDLGAHWIYVPDLNPVAKLAPRSAFDVYPAPAGQKARIGRRNARESEMEDFLSALVRANRAIGDAGRGKTDIACSQALPKDLADWQPTIEFVLGPYGCGKDLSDVSAMDFARVAERDGAAFCRQGFGTLLARLADGIPVQLASPVERVEWGGRAGVEVTTAKGRIAARAAIITVSTGVLGAGKISFSPDLPRRQLDAVASLKPGSYDHIALELPDNPLGLQSDDLVFEKSAGARTAAILANISGTALCTVDVAGRFGRELSAQGEAAMVAFALDWLSALYGADVKKSVRRTHATRWNHDPWTLGAYSVAAPGAQPSRRALMEPLRDRVWFAGEAAHETLWGTVAGAWESGERAADAVIKSFAPAAPQERKPQKPRKRAPAGAQRLPR
jgi:monoamine oxidase